MFGYFCRDFAFICADPKTQFSEKTQPITKYKICLHGLVPTPILNLALPDFFEKSCVSRPFVYLLDHFRHLQRPKQYQFYVLHPKNEVCQLETFPGNVIKKSQNIRQFFFIFLLQKYFVTVLPYNLDNWTYFYTFRRDVEKNMQ